jgi:hypothetical protein
MQQKTLSSRRVYWTAAILKVEVEVTLWLMVSQSVCLGVKSTLELVTRYYFLLECCCLKIAVLSLWGALSDERTGLQFAMQSLNGPSRSSHRRFPQPGGPGSWIYSPQEQGSPDIPLGTGFPLHCLLQLTGLWWRYSNPPPHGNAVILLFSMSY